MRHDSSIKEKVRKLRYAGYSLNELHNEIGIPKSTIRSWIKDISLTAAQKVVFSQRTQLALQAGRIKAQQLNLKQKKERETNLMQSGINDIGKLSSRELFLTGIALYWAEGFKNKNEHRLGFCNSDPQMIRLYIHWAQEVIKVNQQDFVARVTLNYSYLGKTKEIEKYWSEITGLPLSQFTQPFYQHTLWKKQYKNEHYNGVLRIHIKDSLEYLLRMRGWIKGLQLNGNM